MQESESTMPQPIDRVSDLPPEIIHGIVSRLDWSEAARTCILSKTWYGRFWRSYPAVEYHHHSDSDDESKRTGRFRSFAVSSCKRLLLYHIPNGTALTALRISVRGGGESLLVLLHRFLDFISSFSAYCGSPLEVSFETDACFTLPEAVFRYDRTLVLNLGGFNFQNLDICDAVFPKLKSARIELGTTTFSIGSIQLTYSPSLESLEFDHLVLNIASPYSAPNLRTVRISNYREAAATQRGIIDKLIRNLPSLECLSLEKSMFASESRWLMISSPMLKELSFIDCWWYDDHSWSVSKEIEVDAPNLELFHYTYENVQEVAITGLKMVEVARKFRFVGVVRGWKLEEEDCNGTVLWYGGIVEFIESQFQNMGLKVREAECLGTEDLQLVIE